MLTPQSLHNLSFYLGTGHSLRMNGQDDLDEAIKLYHSVVDIPKDAVAPESVLGLQSFQGVVSNNLGMSHVSKFILLSQQGPAENMNLTDAQIKEAASNINLAVKHLKNSVRLLEFIDHRMEAAENPDGTET